MGARGGGRLSFIPDLCVWGLAMISLEDLFFPSHEVVFETRCAEMGGEKQKKKGKGVGAGER